MYKTLGLVIILGFLFPLASHGDPKVLDDVDKRIRIEMALEPIEAMFRPIRYNLYLNQELDKRDHALYQDIIKHIQEVIDYNKTASFLKKQISYTYSLSLKPSKGDLAKFQNIDCHYGKELAYTRDFFSLTNALLTDLQDKTKTLATVTNYEPEYDYYDGEISLSARITIKKEKLEDVLNLLKQKDAHLGWEVEPFNRFMQPYVDKENIVRQKSISDFKYLSVGCQIIPPKGDDERRGDTCSKGYSIAFPYGGRYLNVEGACNVTLDQAKKLTDSLEVCKFGNFPILGRCEIYAAYSGDWMVSLRSFGNKGTSNYDREFKLTSENDKLSPNEAMQFMKTNPLCLQPY